MTLDALGGRKFVQSMTGTLMVPLLALLHAPESAYLALAGIVGSFVAGNAIVTKAAIVKGAPDA